MHRIILLCLLLLLSAACSTNNKTLINADSIKRDSIPIELTTQLGDQQQFVEGDEVQFLLSLGQDAYIYMYHIDAKNNILQILPNPAQHSHFYSAGYFLTIPEYENLYRFTISEPFGEESVWVIASDQSITLDSSLHTIAAIQLKIKQSSAHSYGEYRLSISTRENSRR